MTKKRTLMGMEFTLRHDARKPKIVYVKIPDKPSFKDVFNHPCQKWFDQGYYIHCIFYDYELV